MPLMDFNTWRQKAMQQSGADWNEADARNQYRMYQLRRQGVGDAGAAQKVGQNAYGDTDSTGLRSWSQQHGMGTDRYENFDDATLQVWKEQAWDTNCPPDRPFQAFDGSGCVEKPIDSNTGMGRTPGQGWARSAPGAAPQQQPTGQDAGMAGGYQPQNPLQQRLMDMISQGQGFFGENAYNNAAALKGGGVWWGQGADFSQKFNPLAPQGSTPRQPAQGPTQAQNPFQQAAQPPVQTQGQPTVSPFQTQPRWGATGGLGLPGQNISELTKRLNNFYGGKNQYRV